MCGLAGYVGEVDSAGTLLKSMAKNLTHRGPDSQGISSGSLFGISHCRLAIIDTSQNSTQPITNERFKLIYNGEIYNWKELREEYDLNTKIVTSDTILLFYLLQKLSTREVMRKIRGIYTFAFVDSQNEKTILVRDRFGTKPLYTLLFGETRYYASEIKAFKSIATWKPKINKEALRNYLSFQNNLDNQTIFDGVYMLQPGTIMTIDHQLPQKPKVEIVDFNEPRSLANKLEDNQETRNEFQRLLEQAIERNLVSDVEIGGFLSGGIDSTIIASLASKKSNNYKTFTIGFDSDNALNHEKNFDESETSLQIAKSLNTDHYSQIIDAADMLDSIDATNWAIEDPRVGQSYPNFFASKLAATKLKVCLAGTGGDEIFAGYPWRYSPILASTNRQDQNKKLISYWHRLGDKNEISNLLMVKTGDHVEEVNKQINQILDSYKDKQEELKLQDILIFEQKTFLHGLLLVEDKISMSHSLEVRVPFLDDDLVNYAMTLPDSLKYMKQTDTHTKGKLILRETAKSLNPEISSLRKQGFSAPDETWFREDKHHLVYSRLITKDSILWNYLDYATGTKLINEHLEGKTNRRLLIWSLLSLESVLRQFQF
jgi:asparagine synthase (glutamine-hydrolysing)